jgi:hypothetical protein
MLFEKKKDGEEYKRRLTPAEWQREYRKTEKYKQYKHTYNRRKDVKERKKICHIKWYAENRENWNIQRQSMRQIYRTRLLELLGGARCINPNCAVPGGMTDKRALQFDHINGKGRIDHKNIDSKGESFYLFYLKDPDRAKKELQVYCANCNSIKVHENREYLVRYRRALIEKGFKIDSRSLAKLVQPT